MSVVYILRPLGPNKSKDKKPGEKGKWKWATKHPPTNTPTSLNLKTIQWQCVHLRFRLCPFHFFICNFRVNTKLEKCKKCMSDQSFNKTILLIHAHIRIPWSYSTSLVISRLSQDLISLLYLTWEIISSRDIKISRPVKPKIKQVSN